MTRFRTLRETSHHCATGSPRCDEPRPGSRHLRAAGAAAVAGIGGTAAAVLAMATPGSASPARAHTQPTVTLGSLRPQPPLRVALESPLLGATGVDGSRPVVFSTTGTVELAGIQPTVSPPVPGRWSAARGVLTWTPLEALPPSTHVSFSFPAGVTATGQSSLGQPVTLGFTTAAGSVLGLQQSLAELGYLPLRFTPSTIATTAAAVEQGVYHPAAGSFSWSWPTVPPALAAAWQPGKPNAMTRGAVMAFEHDHGLTADGVAGPLVWSALLRELVSGHPVMSQHGYSFAVASKTLPETLTVWHDGRIITQSRTNSGIPQAPTPDGTFAVYERLRTQVMKGTNPDGTPYADSVAWVAYFNGGDAIHYIARAYYGSPQSLGCLEVPYTVGQAIWPYLTIGTLVAVTG